MTIARLDLPGMFDGLEPTEAKKLTVLIVFAVEQAYQIYKEARARQKGEGADRADARVYNEEAG